jgi:transport and Golgi organization protein 2
MCTLTVVTGNGTYRIAMNRDEKITRGAGLPPQIHEFDGTRVICPGDGTGGAWIAVNEYGIALALLNWNDIGPPRIAADKTRSRGRVIPALIDSRSLSQLHAVFDISNFKGMLPFRLVGVFPLERKIREWRWDSAQLESQVHLWESRHWFSSSLSDQQAEAMRGAACRNAWSEKDAGSLSWLRRLHASHATGPGPFSVCVHREEVKTLSYSEIECMSAGIRLEHFLGSPCDMGRCHSIEIRRARSLDLFGRSPGMTAAF